MRTACAAGTADTQFANYAFASELGSGVYDISGRTITVYQLQPDYRLRPAAPSGARPGINLVFPLTVGFFNFQTTDLVHLQLPNSIGAVSLEPGIELDYWLNDQWDVYPYLKAGGTFSSSAGANAVIYGAGVRSDYRFDAFGSAGLWRAELGYAGVHYHGDLPNDSFTRLRDGVATFECTTYSRHQEGDHTILLGRVENHTRGTQPPLILHAGQMGSLWDLAQTLAPPE